MSPLETFDKDVKDLVSTGKLSASKIQSVTEAAISNIQHDAHIVATLFKVHKQAKANHKISSLYIIDAIAREARQQIKKGKDRTASDTPTQDGSGAEDTARLGKKTSKNGTCAGFLTKIENFLVRVVAEVIDKGPPEHKEKVKKVLDIWSKTSTFGADALKGCYAKLSGEEPPALTRTDSSKASERSSGKKKASTSSSAQKSAPSGRSTTPPYPPPEGLKLPSFPASWQPRDPGPSKATAQPAAATPPIAAPTTTASTTVPAFIPPNGQSDQLARLLALQQQATQPVSSQEPKPEVNAPTFAIDQLALLQQLAAQTTVQGAAQSDAPNFSGSNFASTSTFPSNPYPASLPANHDRSNHDIRSSGYPDGHSGRGRGDWGNFNEDQGRRQRRRDDSDEPRDNGWSRRQNRRRSSSPPQRREQDSNRSFDRDDPHDVDRSHRGGYRGRGRGAGGPSQRMGGERPIASFVSDDPPEDSAGRPTRGRKEVNRRDYDSADVSDFVINTVEDNRTSDDRTSTTQQPAPPPASNNETESSGYRPDPSAIQNIMSNTVQGFNPMQFNSTDPESWAGFANMLQNMLGYMPSNTEMMGWMMRSMQAAQMSQMGGGMMGIGMGIGTGMATGMGNGNPSAGAGKQANQPGSSQQGQQVGNLGHDGSGSKETAQTQQATQEAGDEGDGEAEMDMGDDS